MSAPKRHCAIYTRKSTEDRLDMEFNSLEAQRESCLAYITSQKSEGWSAVPAQYDDGGYSGGTMERPALSQLLADIAAGRVHIVVVYKIDRLTRSLMDFAKLVQVFDQYGVTFVSVTQSFNTTTSMGRLTLNVLLSFAQFEREVTGERIRDKIAASKRKGMWMGGNPSLGYDVKDRHLVINEAEAKTVRHIFTRYLAVGSVRELQAELDRDGIVSKLRKFTTGRSFGGCSIGRGALYTILSNPIYIGRIRHRQESYGGQHQPIVPMDLWDAIQERLKAQAAISRGASNVSSGSLLKGLLFDEAGAPYTPSFAIKAGKRYHYYIGPGEPKHRLPAHSLEAAIEQSLRNHLCSEDRAAVLFGIDEEDHHSLLREIAQSQDRIGIAKLIEAIRRIIIRPGELAIDLDPSALLKQLKGIDGQDLPSRLETATIIIPFVTQRAARGAIVIQPKTHNHDPLDLPPEQLKKLVEGFIWRDQHFAGQTIRQIAAQNRKSDSYVGTRIFDTFNVI